MIENAIGPAGTRREPFLSFFFAALRESLFSTFPVSPTYNSGY